MIEFWDTIHKTYFRPLDGQDKLAIDYVKTNMQSENIELRLSDVPVFLNNDSIDALVSLLSSKYENLYDSELVSMAKQNFANMTKQYYLAMHYYLPLLCEDRDVFCPNTDSCQK